MFSTPDFWVFVAFALFIGLFWKRGFALLTQALDKHKKKVAQQLDEAQYLHDEALSLLKAYKKKHEEALEQAEKIVSSAKKEALELKKSNEQEFEKFLLQKEKALLERIALETKKAKSKLKDQAAEEAFAIIEAIFARNQKERGKLTKAALKDIANLDLKAIAKREIPK